MKMSMMEASQLLRQRVFIAICMCMSLMNAKMVTAQTRRTPRRSSRSNYSVKPLPQYKFEEKSWDGLIIGFSYGPISANNERLHQYLLANNVSAVPSFDETMFTIQYQSDVWNGSFSLAMVGTNQTSALGGGYFNFSAGRTLYQTNFFRSNLNAQFGVKGISMHGFVPPSITNPQARDYLLSSQAFVGMTFQNYFRLFQFTREKPENGWVRIKQRALLLGVDFSAEIFTDGPWQWGHASGSGKHSHFNGVDIPEIPHLDNITTTLRVSLVWKF